MVGVLGHEIGHVTARHTAQRQTQATGAGVLATLGTIAAAVLGGEVAGQLAQQATCVGAQAYLASYSRDQEFQADDLGVGYMTAAGYDPDAMATFLEKLAAESALDREIAGGDGDRLRAGSRPTREPSTGCSARPTRPKPRPMAADARDGRNTWPGSTV